MKHALAAFFRTLATGLLIIVPVYLAILLLLKGMKTVATLVKPFARLLPESVPAESLLSLLLVLLICYIIGFAVRTRPGKIAREQLEKTFFERIPGYALLRSFTQQIAGNNVEKVWKPALVEIEDALVMGFIIEEFKDGRYTVFIPSIPTPLAGAAYVMDRNRVHPVNVPFTEALKVVSRWGIGIQKPCGFHGRQIMNSQYHVSSDVNAQLNKNESFEVAHKAQKNKNKEREI